MGIMPLQFLPEQNADSLQLTGKEKFTITMPESLSPRQQLTVKVGNQQQQQPKSTFPLVTRLEAIVTPVVCPCRPAKESPSPSRPCSTARSTLSSSDTEATSDMSLGLSSENDPPQRGPLLPAVVETHEQQLPPPVCLQHGWEMEKKKNFARAFEPDVPQDVSDIWTASSSSSSPFRTEMVRGLPREPRGVVHVDARVLRMPLLTSRTRDKMRWILLASVYLTKKVLPRKG